MLLGILGTSLLVKYFNSSRSDSQGRGTNK